MELAPYKRSMSILCLSLLACAVFLVPLPAATAQGFFQAKLHDGLHLAIVNINVQQFYPSYQVDYVINAFTPTPPAFHFTEPSLLGCTSLSCSLPPATSPPTWTQPGPSVWEAVGSFSLTPESDPLLTTAVAGIWSGRLLQMTYANPGPGSTGTATALVKSGNWTVYDSESTYLLPPFFGSPLQPLPSVPNANLHASHTGGGVYARISRSPTGLEFDLQSAVFIIGGWPITGGYAFFLRNTTDTDPLCVDKDMKNPKSQANEKCVKDKSKEKKLRGRGDNGDGSATGQQQQQEYEWRVNLGCPYPWMPPRPDLYVCGNTLHFSFEGMNATELAASPKYQALDALAEYVDTGFSSRLVNVTLTLWSFDMLVGPDALLGRIV